MKKFKLFQKIIIWVLASPFVIIGLLTMFICASVYAGWKYMEEYLCWLD